MREAPAGEGEAALWHEATGSSPEGRTDYMAMGMAEPALLAGLYKADTGCAASELDFRATRIACEGWADLMSAGSPFSIPPVQPPVGLDQEAAQRVPSPTPPVSRRLRVEAVAAELREVRRACPAYRRSRRLRTSCRFALDVFANCPTHKPKG